MTLTVMTPPDGEVLSLDAAKDTCASGQVARMRW